jgi:hypothetical protein
MISDIKDPFERYIAFIKERDAIYWRKTGGEPWPWTDDKILQTYRFTEVYRERDRTSLHYQKTIRKQYMGAPAQLPGTVLYRWFNRIETCDLLFNLPDFNNQTTFERYLLSDCKDIRILDEFIDKTPPPHATGAFIITGRPGYDKGHGIMQYFHYWCSKPWQEQWDIWQENSPELVDVFRWLKEHANGLGDFMAAQLVADLKYLPFLSGAEDWWIFAAPGPGSKRGLNAVLGRDMNTHWKGLEWFEKIQELREAENKVLVPQGIGPFHAQDTQNHCCEFSKYTKVMTGVGRPRQTYNRIVKC